MRSPHTINGNAAAEHVGQNDASTVTSAIVPASSFVHRHVPAGHVQFTWTPKPPSTQPVTFLKHDPAPPPTLTPEGGHPAGSPPPPDGEGATVASDASPA